MHLTRLLQLLSSWVSSFTKYLASGSLTQRFVRLSGEGRVSHLFAASNWVWLCAVVCLAYFLVLDEEPCLDFSDWSLLHSFCLLLGVVLVYTETRLRAGAGQATTLDDTVQLAALVTWVRLTNYMRLILGCLGYHYLVPLEADLLELVEVFLVISGWLLTVLLPQLTLCLLLTAVGVVAVQVQPSVRLIRVLCLAVVLALLGVFCVLAFDLLLLFSSHVGSQNLTTFYSKPQASFNIRPRLGTGDAADWHKTGTHPRSLRFTGLTEACLSLFTLLAVVEALMAWVLLGLSSLQPGVGGLTGSQLATGALWLKHLVWAFLTPWFFLTLTSVRLLFRLCFGL